ncbi:hypothetical protein DFH28DRAFT_1132967 [Melampsora americana]|nr:hypothetical protein DFH28DRAFT_1132967 [Melampsora americana]
MFPCSGCDSTFDTRGKRDHHVAATHRETINVTNGQGDVMEVSRKDGVFRCPMGDCTYQHKRPKSLGAHLAVCKGTGPRDKVRAPDKSGARVVPLGEDIIASEALSEYGLVWNERCSILICVQCHKGVPPTEALDDLSAYTEVAVQPISPVLPPGYELGKPCEPVQGLKIYNGFSCTLCNRAYPELKTIKEHFWKKHNDIYTSKLVVQHIIATKCQKLYSHNLRYYFAVLPGLSRPRHVLPGHDRSPSPELEHSDAVQLLVSKLDAHASHSPLVADPEKDSQLSNWLYVSGIHHYIADLIHRGRTYNNEEIAPDSVSQRCGRQQRPCEPTSFCLASRVNKKVVEVS